ncbi:MAG: hypothetical protein FWG80_03890 [Alphaproteobacteria bacterium]|nr:hypothetical protein [Alphaproteobacteria bacterium]
MQPVKTIKYEAYAITGIQVFDFNPDNQYDVYKKTQQAREEQSIIKYCRARRK